MAGKSQNSSIVHRAS